MGARRGLGVKVSRGGSPSDNAGVKKRSMTPANGLRNDAHALMALAAATQHAAGQEVLLQPAEHHLEPARQESVSSDNDYSEEQYQLEKQRAPRTGAGANESEEEKKEKRRLANREAARRMRRRRATHMAAVEEEAERLSQENSLLLHRMSQLVASHQAVDAENARLRADLMALRHSVGACLHAGQLDIAGGNLAAVVANGGTVSPSLVAPVPRPAIPPAASEPLPEQVASVTATAVRRLVAEPQQRVAAGAPNGQPAGVPSSSTGQSTENEMTAIEDDRLTGKYSGGSAAALARPDQSFATSAGEAVPSMGRTQRKKGSAWKNAGTWLSND